MSALPNCFKTDIFRKHLTWEILNSLWIMPYQSHCLALRTAEVEACSEQAKCLHEVKDVTLPLHSLTTMMRVTSRYSQCGRHLAEGRHSRFKGRRAAMGDLASFGSFPQPQCKGRKGNRVIKVLLLSSVPLKSTSGNAGRHQLLLVWNAFLRWEKSCKATSWEIRKEFFPRAQVG